jgi:predicted porin
MKKLLMSTAALAGLAFIAASPARADEPALQLGLGGFIAGYAAYTDLDTAPGDSRREVDFRKVSEVHLNGEVALDNGITAGAHMEMLADRSDGDNTVQESYLYLSSSWGRVNVGEEDGIAYLLQVGAPSADDNIDGIRPEIGTFDFAVNGGTMSYAQDPFGYTNKLTYITPVFNGFQAGVSYTPTIGIPNLPIAAAAGLPGVALIDQSGLSAAQSDDDIDQFENGWEVAARYEGSFDAVDVALGAGYSHASLEAETGASTFDDDFHMWNVGANVGFGAFGVGAAYVTTNNGVEDDFDTDAVVAGVDYTTGAYKLGFSYMNAEQEAGAGVDEIDVDRYTGGVIYEWGPGMTFRGAVQWQEADDGTDDADGTQVTFGTQLDF